MLNELKSKIIQSSVKMKPTRLRVKIQAVEMIQKGENINSVSKKIKANPELIEKWCKAYLSAGKHALRYTGDEGEVPSLVDLQRTAQKAFPTRLLHGCNSVASFFCAQFYGRNDVIHIYNSGIPEVTLIDLDNEKLQVMKGIYPDNWRCELGDAFEKAHEFASQGKKYDCVICDPFSSLSSKVAWEEFATFSAISSNLLFLLYSQKMFDEMGKNFDDKEVAKKIEMKVGSSVNLIGIYKRSSHAGGIYWCAFKISS